MTAPTIKHSFNSPKADGTDATLVQPSHWNADHTLQQTGIGLIGKSTAGTGACEVLGIGSGLLISNGQLVATAQNNGGSAIAVLDEGTLLTAGVTTINFTGASVTANASGTAVTVDVAGGNGGTGATNLSSTASATSVIIASDTGLDATIGAATSSVAGVMSASDKTRLDTVATGATANSTDTFLKDRANHTGTQAISTITGLQAEIDLKADISAVTSAITTLVGSAPTNLNTLEELANAVNNDPLFSTTISNSLAGKAAAGHTHTIANVTGLQTALDSKATPADVTAAITAVVNAAPAALDTLGEIAAQLASDESAVAALTTAVAGKAAVSHTHAIANVTGLQTALDGKTAVGHAHATSDVTGLDAALAGKASASHSHSTANIAGLDASLAGKSDIGHSHTIANVSGLQTALDAKASTAQATLSTDGLLSAADKFKINNMPSPQFLWDAVHARTPIIAHAGDSISYMTGQGNGDNYLLQSLSREYPARVEYGEHKVQCYTGTLSGVVNGDTTATLTYDGASSDAAFMESQFAVNKWLFFPTSGVGHGWDGQEMQIIGFNTTAKTITVKSDIQYLPATGPLTTFGSTSGVTLKISETADRYVLAKGGHTSTQIKDGQIRAIQAWTTPPDIMILNGGTNDGTYLTSHTNLIAVAEAALAAGVKIVALMPMSPKDAMASNPNAMRQFISSKNIMATYARNRDGCYLVDPSGVFLDPTSASYQPIGASSGTINAVMADGLHPSVRGAEISAKFITPLIQKIGARRYPKALSIADVWDATNNKAGNILGTSGTMLVTNGGTLNGATNTGLADGWTVNTSTTAVSGGPNVAPAVSIVDCDYVAPGYKAQRFDFTGLRSGQWGGVLSMNFSRWNPSVFSADPRLDAEIVIRVNCPNIYSVRLAVGITGGTSQGDSVDLGATSQNAAGTIKVSSDWIFLTLKRPFKTFNFNQQCDFSIVINGLSDAPLSGTIDIAHCGLFALHTS